MWSGENFWGLESRTPRKVLAKETSDMVEAWIKDDELEMGQGVDCMLSYHGN